MSYTDSQHRNNLTNFYQAVEMPGGWSFNHPERLKTNDLYYNSKFKGGQYDRMGYRKFFYNEVKPACDIATKFVDLDTRDILLTAENEGDEMKVFLMQRRLKQWLKDKNFGVLMNDVAFYAPIHGHIVLKKCKDGWDLVPLENLRMDTKAKTLKRSPYIYELMEMNKHEIDEMGVWNTTELYARGKEETYFIYESFCKEGGKWRHKVMGDLWSKQVGDGTIRSVESEINRQGENYVGSCVLLDEMTDNIPYREWKWEDVPGRWLGRGFVELLEDNQIARNETENIERKAMIFNGLKIWQTRSQDLSGKNVLSSAKNGDILQTESEISPVLMEERNLAQYNSSRENWDRNTQRKTFTSDITTGASLPSRTPLGVANLQATLASSFFERKREEMGLFYKALLLEDIIPDFKGDTMEEQNMVFYSSDEEIEWLDNAIASTLVDDKAYKYSKETGWWLTKEEKEYLRLQVKDELKGKKNRYLKIPASFWDNAHYMIDINITGESNDNGVKAQLIQMVLQIVGTNPAVMQNPMSKAMIFKLLSLGGINPAELGFFNVPEAAPTGQPIPGQQTPQVAGSLSVPSPIQGQMQTTQSV